MYKEEIEFLSMNNAVLHNQIKQLTAERDDLAIKVESLTEQLKQSWENEPEWIDELRQHAKGTLGRACEERDTYKQALDDLGVTPTEAKAGVARSKALFAERDALKAALENVVGALAVVHNGGGMYALTPNEYMRCIDALKERVCAMEWVVNVEGLCKDDE